jgi:hypothetical protein
MTGGIKKLGRFTALTVGLCFACMQHARAVLVDLDLYVTYSILNHGGGGANVLADGSWVVVVGSGNNVNDGMYLYGGTNYVADWAIGDDIILGYVFIGDNSFANTGKFFSTFQYDSTQVGYVYIRYFETTGPLTGMIYWGQSDVINLNPTNFGVVTIDVSPGSSLIASNYSNFVVIPEPSTGPLIFMTGGLLLAWQFSRNRRRSKQKPSVKSLE